MISKVVFHFCKSAVFKYLVILSWRSLFRNFPFWGDNSLPSILLRCRPCHICTWWTLQVTMLTRILHGNGLLLLLPGSRFRAMMCMMWWLLSIMEPNTLQIPRTNFLPWTTAGASASRQEVYEKGWRRSLVLRWQKRIKQSENSILWEKKHSQSLSYQHNPLKKMFDLPNLKGKSTTNFCFRSGQTTGRWTTHSS